MAKLGATKNLKAKARKKLIKQCDDLVSLIVRTRDGRCVTCHTTNRLTCSHLIKRGRASTRFDLKNCNCQCSSCNFRHNQYPEVYTNWWLEHYGLETYRELFHRASQLKKWTTYDLESLKTELERYLEHARDNGAE